jgi:Uri superfamily endonuclease
VKALPGSPPFEDEPDEDEPHRVREQVPDAAVSVDARDQRPRPERDRRREREGTLRDAEGAHEEFDEVDGDEDDDERQRRTSTGHTRPWAPRRQESTGETRTDGGSEGTYTLVVEFDGPATVEVGALGAVEFDADWYAYTGSAFGPGGFARVERHRELAAGEREARHWHVDYLLGHPAAEFDRVPAFGASDCECESHLVAAPALDPLVAAVQRAHGDERMHGDGRTHSGESGSPP